MVALQRLAGRLWPGGGHHPGGLGWTLATDELYPTLHVALEEGRLAGWAGASSEEFEVHVESGSPDAVMALVDWALGVASAESVSVAIFDGDEAVREAVADAGFMVDPRRALHGMFRPTIRAAPPPPSGYRVRAVLPGEEDARVEAHRTAWQPEALPWAEGSMRTVDPEETSRFSRERFDAVRAAWLYDPALDLVVEGPDGRLAGCCTVWWDPSLGVAEIEPLGVDPQHRRRGLATAMCLEAAARVGDRGGHQVFINTGPRDDYPAPAATYIAAGFLTVGRGTLWTRPG